MAVEMSAARFAALTDAYGGDLGRWPADARIAAFAIARTAQGHDMLAEAAALDAALDRFTVPEPSMRLSDRIMASAPQPRRAWARATRWRWAGFGGIGLAGTAAGALLVAAVPPVPGVVLDAGYEQTAFGNLVADGEE